MHSAKSRKIIYFILMSLLCIFTFATMNSNVQQLDADTHITFDGEDFSPVAELAQGTLNGGLHILTFVVDILVLAVFNLIAALCGRILLSKKFEAPSREEAKKGRIFYLALCAIALLVAMITGKSFSFTEKLMMVLTVPLFWELLYFKKIRKRCKEAEQATE